MKSLFSSPAQAALFSPAAHVAKMLLYEAALARVQARAGMIPASAAQKISDACRIELVDVPALYRDAVDAGTLVIPLLKQLNARLSTEARDFLHYGATSQDVIDTALMLQMREGIDLLLDDLAHICARCAELAEEHRRTLMAGRTLLQHAAPITFGLKAARWLDLTMRQVTELRNTRANSIALQYGGAVGTLAAWNNRGIEISQMLAQELDLNLPNLPWHAERDRVARIASTVAITAGAMSKIATDIALLAQTEVGEVRAQSKEDKGGSSAMPHKQNPVDAMETRAAAQLANGAAMVIFNTQANEHERAAGAWQAEWDAIPNLFCYTGGAVMRVRRALQELEIDAVQMRVNMDTSGGALVSEALTLALAEKIGKVNAQSLVQSLFERARASGKNLRAVAAEDAQVRAALSKQELEDALNPAHFLGSADFLIARVLEEYQNEARRGGGEKRERGGREKGK